MVKFLRLGVVKVVLVEVNVVFMVVVTLAGVQVTFVVRLYQRSGSGPRGGRITSDLPQQPPSRYGLASRSVKFILSAIINL